MMIHFVPYVSLQLYLKHLEAKIHPVKVLLMKSLQNLPLDGAVGVSCIKCRNIFVTLKQNLVQNSKIAMFPLYFYCWKDILVFAKVIPSIFVLI